MTSNACPDCGNLRDVPGFAMCWACDRKEILAARASGRPRRYRIHRPPVLPVPVRYRRLRNCGVPWPDAAQRVGISRETAEQYERGLIDAPIGDPS